MKNDNNDNLTPHVAWLLCLHTLFKKARREGFLSIEDDICNPDREGSIFKEFPHVMRKPYLDFATDLLRLMVNGFDEPDELAIYAEYAIAGFTKSKLFKRVDKSLLQTIWLPIWSMAKGRHPFIAFEFGRQAIPAEIKPSADELYELLSKDKTRMKDGGLDADVDSFMASLDENQE